MPDAAPIEQVFFASATPAEINAADAGQTIAGFWGDFTRPGKDLNYGRVLTELLDWAKRFDASENTRVLPSRKLLPNELTEKAKQLKSFALDYNTILTEIANSLSLELNTPAYTASEKKEKRIMVGQKAVFNQRLAAEFEFLAAEPEYSQQRKNAQIFLDIAEVLSRMDGPGRTLGVEIKTSAAGAKAQVAVARLLRLHGFNTITPDWRKYWEVYDMDVHSKTDLAAFNGERLLFIDAKSRALTTFDDERMVNHLGTVETIDSYRIFLRQARLADDMRRKINSLTNQQFEHYEVHFPTFEDSVGKFGEKLDPNIERGILAGLKIK